MNVTNKYNYPEPFAVAAKKNTYTKGEADYSITELNSPPRLVQLTKRHDGELTEDVSERLWMLLGTVAHEILERGGREGQELTEERLYATVGGKKIGGKLDTLCLGSGLLTDYKLVSVWSYILGTKPEWTAQANCYAFLARENGHTVNALEIFAMFRDWSESKSLGSGDYPKTNCLRIPLEMWPHEKTRDYIKERVLLHDVAKLQGDDFLPACTPEERWEKPTTYAVMKPGRKSALSVHDTLEAATAALAPGCSVVTRPGTSRRCASYCPVGGSTGLCSVWVADPTRVEATDAA